MRVAIIGGGAAGLCSARHVKEDGHEFEVFEMTSQIGGTWVYTDDVGEDKYGYPIYSAMYQGLRTTEILFETSRVLDFLKKYAEYFGLEPFVRNNHMVTDLRPLGNEKWRLTAIYKPTNDEIVKEFDSVVICNGHHNEPNFPQIEGQEKFNGWIVHSHKYRSPKPFTGRKVLVVGAGPSGLDIALQISDVAEKVVLSHHVRKAKNIDFIDQKPDIRRIVDGEMVEFVDDSCFPFDCILFCTGFQYSFPFLHESCGITVTDNYIQPLYKHMINIQRPTMCFIGIPFRVIAIPMLDLQAKFFSRYLNGSMALPSKEMMLLDTEQDMQARWEKGYKRRHAHSMGPFQQKYYDDLAKLANISGIPPMLV